MKVLVVDDETPIVEVICYNLRKEGYVACFASNAETCMEAVKAEQPDLIILDVMLPAASGFDVCRALRRQSNVPIIMLTAKAEETDRVVGLELGADDYITKPFSIRELMSRVKAVLRRTRTSEVTGTGVIRVGQLKIDPVRYEVTIEDQLIDLSPKEFELLRFLATHAGQVFSRQALLDRVWGPDAYVEDRTVDVHIRWLREKVETTPSKPDRLLTVRGVGYKYRSD
jgi:phosphate regulon transcriptional regulator PhoB